MVSKKKINNSEIDLVELINIIFKNKWKVAIITSLSLLLTLIIHIRNTENNQNAIFYNAKIKIYPITAFEEFKYETYNGYLKHNNSKNKFYSIGRYNFNETEELGKNFDENFILKEYYSYKNIDYSSFPIINRQYLFELFVEKFNEKLILVDGIKKFQLINRNNFKSDDEYEGAVLKLASKVKLNIIKKNNEEIPDLNLIFSTKSENKNIWIKLLRSFQEKANLEIQNHIYNSFNEQVLNQLKLFDYKIEDIEFLKLNTSKGSAEYLELENIKKYILENKDIERLKTAFKTTPVEMSDKFYAAKIAFETIELTKIVSKERKLGLKTKIVLSIFVGLLFSIIYILIESSIRRQGR